MTAPIDALILQFLAWVDSETPTYAQVLDAWQSACPRLSVWRMCRSPASWRSTAAERGMWC